MAEYSVICLIETINALTIKPMPAGIRNASEYKGAGKQKNYGQKELTFDLNFFIFDVCASFVPVTVVKSTSQKIAPVKFAPSRFVSVITAAVKSTPLRSAPEKLTRLKSARMNCELDRFALEKFE